MSSGQDNSVEKFWEARRLTQKNLLNESEQAYQKVANDARDKYNKATDNKLTDDALIADIAEAAILELKGKYDDAIRLLKQVVRVSSGYIKGVANFMLGSIYRERFQNRFDDAITSYEDALKENDFDKKAWVYNNLGNIYFRKATNLKKRNPHRLDYLELARDNYDKSIENNKDITKYITYYNQGRLALAKELYDDAINKFSQAINDAGDDYDMHGCCYREIGTAYIFKALAFDGQSFHDAIRCWEKASKMFEKAELSAGEAAGKLGKSAVVLAKIRVAKHYRDKLETINSNDKVLLTWWPPDESGADGYSTPEERIFSMIEATGRDRYQLYNTRSSSRFASRKRDNIEVSSKNVLAVLRGWGSASPLIEDALSACVGGGYFLKWLDKGIVIDPGIDFMRNFRAHGFHMREVDAVIVSHDHTDHNADLRAIDDVFYEMYRRADEDAKGEIDRNWHYYLICDKSSGKKDFLQSKNIDENEQTISAKKSNFNHRTIIEMDSDNLELKGECPINLRKWGLPFIINYFRAQHGQMSANCLRIDCLSEEGKEELKIGFTCDTQYFDELGSHFKGKKKCNILVAHVSQPELAELLSNNATKKYHLGYRGVSKLIKDCKPGLTVVGEFWAGFADMRIDITKGLKRICDDNAILPSSVGLFISPKGKDKEKDEEKLPEIECTNCRKWRSSSSIYVGAASHEFGPLAYLCPLCRI